MISDRYASFLYKIVSNELFGFLPGSLVCVEHHCGGGFVGAPEVLVLAPITMLQLPVNKVLGTAEFVQPNVSLEYRVGGSAFGTYHYWRE